MFEVLLQKIEARTLPKLYNNLYILKHFKGIGNRLNADYLQQKFKNPNWSNVRSSKFTKNTISFGSSAIRIV